MGWRLAMLCAACGVCAGSGARETDPPPVELNPRLELQAAGETLTPAAQQADKLFVEGKFEEATKVLLDVFPEAKRTPMQELMLGNAFFGINRKRSYALHKSAAEKLPENMDAQFEWAIEQHRAKEYEGALKAYKVALAARPGYVPLRGLVADCAIRTGDIALALAMWTEPQKSPTGTLQQFEVMVCEVNSGRDAPLEREELLKKVVGGDEKAAVDLLLLDSAWPFNWWTEVPNKPCLENDQRTTLKWLPPGVSDAVRESRTLARCASVPKPDKDKIGRLLKEDRCLIDADFTLPTEGRCLRLLLKYAVLSGAISREEARARLGERTIALAKKTKDADAFEAAAFLYPGMGKMEEIDRLGWELAHSATCAAAVLAGMEAKKTLTWESEELQKAMKEFPNDSRITGFAVRAGIAAGKPKKDLLIAGIKAEYTKFSGAEVRGDKSAPSSAALRGYFKMLAEEK